MVLKINGEIREWFLDVYNDLYLKHEFLLQHFILFVLEGL